MSFGKPGEPRWCSDCSAMTGGAAPQPPAQAAQAVTAAPDDDLALQPFENEGAGSPRRDRLGPRPMNFRPPAKPANQSSRTAIPAVRRQTSATGIPAVQPAPPQPPAAPPPQPPHDELAVMPFDADANPEAAAQIIPPAEPRAGTSSKRLMPAARRSGAAHPAMSEFAPPPLEPPSTKDRVLAILPACIKYVVVGVVLLFAGKWAYNAYLASVAAPSETTAKAAERKKADDTPDPAPNVSYTTRETTKPETKPAPVEPKTAPAPVEEKKPAVAEAKKEVPAAPAVATKEAPRAGADILDMISSGPRKSPKARADDEEPDNTETTRPAKPPEGPASAEKKPADDTAALLLGKKTAEKTPAAKPEPVRVTATEPTVVPFDVQTMPGGNDRQFTEMLALTLPGWRIRDVNPANSVTGANTRGRDRAIGINPINDAMTAKLIATIEIPEKASAKLRFEVASADAKRRWLLTVRIMNQPVITSVPIQTTDKMAWVDVPPLDLSRFAGKRFDLSIEVAMAPKTPSKNYKDQVGYVRNIRFEFQKAELPAVAKPQQQNPPPPADPPQQQ
jgi:hypothetical protein